MTTGLPSVENSEDINSWKNDSYTILLALRIHGMGLNQS